MKRNNYNVGTKLCWYMFCVLVCLLLLPYSFTYFVSPGFMKRRAGRRISVMRMRKIIIRNVWLSIYILSFYHDNHRHCSYFVSLVDESRNANMWGIRKEKFDCRNGKHVCRHLIFVLIISLSHSFNCFVSAGGVKRRYGVGSVITWE